MSAAKARKSATKAAVRPSRGDVVAQKLMRRVDRLIAQTAVCAAAATLVCEDGAKRAYEAAGALPAMLDEIREQLETLHGDIEFLVPEERP
ncbi:MAG TPA: hypothetical protein VIH60_04840 [Steroidobacteraceae bacterium]